jgi:hypothetical protein
VGDFGMVEVKHKSRYLCNNLLFAHQAQQMYYLSYPHESIKHWWVVYKVNPEMDTHRYDAYMEDKTMMMLFMSIKKKMKDVKV